MSYFNEEQRKHMRHLASIPAEERCWCGWARAGACDTASPCPPDVTLADRQRTEQPCCGRPAPRPDFPRTMGSHYAGCSRRWFQEPPKASFWHYDVCKSKRTLAVAAGAIEVDRNGLVAAVRRIRASGVFRAPGAGAQAAQPEPEFEEK